MNLCRYLEVQQFGGNSFGTESSGLIQQCASLALVVELKSPITQ